MNWMAVGSVVLIVIGTVMGYAATYKSDQESERIQTELKNVRDYNIYSMMNIYGTDRMIDAGPGIKITQHSDLYDRMDRILIRTGEIAGVRNDTKLLPEIDSVIEKYPYFPFGYYAKAQLLREMKNEKWRVSAQKAIDIFKITTAIQGHSTSQDDALKVLEIQMAE